MASFFKRLMKQLRVILPNFFENIKFTQILSKKKIELFIFSRKKFLLENYPAMGRCCRIRIASHTYNWQITLLKAGKFLQRFIKQSKKIIERQLNRFLTIENNILSFIAL
jgi:hypothetical protein